MSDWLSQAQVGDECLIGGGDYTHYDNAFRDEDDFFQMCRECHGYAPTDLSDADLDVATLRPDGLWVDEKMNLWRIEDAACPQLVGKADEEVSGEERPV